MSEQLPTTNESNPFLDYGNQASMRTIVGRILKFSQGDYLAGQDNTEIPRGTQLLVNMDSLSVGWIKWADNKPIEHMMGLVSERFQPPQRGSLDWTDETLWEKDPSTGKPRDPWQFSNQVVMKVPGSDDQDELFTFVTSSRGGINAVGELSIIYGKHMRTHPDKMPIVSLQGDSYDHPNKQLGRIKIPLLKVVDWASKTEFEDAQGELAMEETKALPQTHPQTQF